LNSTYELTDKSLSRAGSLLHWNCVENEITGTKKPAEAGFFVSAI
jgi:hypothetical protein